MASVMKAENPDKNARKIEKRTSARTSGFLPEAVKNIADASGFVKIRQKACNLTKKRQISMNISPRVYILHEDA